MGTPPSDQNALHFRGDDRLLRHVYRVGTSDDVMKSKTSAHFLKIPVIRDSLSAYLEIWNISYFIYCIYIYTESAPEYTGTKLRKPMYFVRIPLQHGLAVI